MTRIGAVGGLISALFLGVAFVIASSFAIHYWHELKQPGLGQRKKNRLRIFKRRWIFIAVISATIGIAGAACYYFGPQIVQTIVQPEKQYVSIINSAVEMSANESPALSVVVENGPGDVTITFRDVTPTYTEFVPEEYLLYKQNVESSLKVTPHNHVTHKWRFTQLTLTQANIHALNDKPPQAELYFFGNLDWIDESGQTHTLPFCYEYTTELINHLAYCPQRIKIK